MMNPKKLMLRFGMPLVLHRLLGGQAGPQDFRCFCLPASGAIAVKQDLFHSNGSISIINSSARDDGGVLLLSSSGVGTTWLETLC